jgi:DNA-binding NtrC family response regulator
VRELRNTLERALVTCSSEILTKGNLGLDFGRPVVVGANDGLRLRPGMTVVEAPRRLIQETLAFTQNHQARAAKLLGISLKTVQNKLKSMRLRLKAKLTALITVLVLLVASQSQKPTSCCSRAEPRSAV